MGAGGLVLSANLIDVVDCWVGANSGVSCLGGILGASAGFFLLATLGTCAGLVGACVGLSGCVGGTG